MKIFMLTILLGSFPFSAEAHSHKAEHRHYGGGLIEWLDQAPNTFTATGEICSGPKMNEYGELITTYIEHAKQLADQEASEKCYPFQSYRESDYVYANTNQDCKYSNPYAVRETVTASYSCAK